MNKSLLNNNEKKIFIRLYENFGKEIVYERFKYKLTSSQIDSLKQRLKIKNLSDFFLILTV